MPLASWASQVPTGSESERPLPDRPQPPLDRQPHITAVRWQGMAEDAGRDVIGWRCAFYVQPDGVMAIKSNLPDHSLHTAVRWCGFILSAPAGSSLPPGPPHLPSTPAHPVRNAPSLTAIPEVNTASPTKLAKALISGMPVEDFRRAHLHQTPCCSTPTAGPWKALLPGHALPNSSRPGCTDGGRHGMRVSARKPASSAENGSSRSSNFGFGAKARASATRCCSPPESCAARDPRSGQESPAPVAPRRDRRAAPLAANQR